MAPGCRQPNATRFNLVQAASVKYRDKHIESLKPTRYREQQCMTATGHMRYNTSLSISGGQTQ
eukprot:5682932-Amphidinium_carterae.1